VEEEEAEEGCGRRPEIEEDALEGHQTDRVNVE
jgi:hypothetical protein